MNSLSSDTKLLGSFIYSKNCDSSLEKFSAGFLSFSSKGTCIIEKSCFLKNTCKKGSNYESAHDVSAITENITIEESSILFSYGNLRWCPTISIRKALTSKVYATNQSQNEGTNCVAGYIIDSKAIFKYNYVDSNRAHNHMIIYFGNSDVKFSNSLIINNVVGYDGILLIEYGTNAYFENLSLVYNTGDCLFSRSLYKGRPKMTIETCYYVNNTVKSITNYEQNDLDLNSSFIKTTSFEVIFPCKLDFCEKIVPLRSVIISYSLLIPWFFLNVLISLS